MWIVKLPLKVPVSKNKDFTLNLNQYRNTYFQTLNKAKVNFYEIVAPRLKGIPKLDRCELLYTVYPQSKQLFDISNVGSIVDKFFCDTLTGAKILEDDNYKHVVSIRYAFGEVDKLNPRVEVTITPIGDLPQNEKEEDMQIILAQPEVEQAIKDYIANRLTLAEGTEIQIDLSATRGADGIKATIDLVPAGTKAPKIPPTKLDIKGEVEKSKQTEKKPYVVIKPEPVAVPAPVVEVAEAAPEVVTEVVEEVAATGLKDPIAEAIESQPAEQVADVAPAPKSLFAGLKKPVNS